MEWDADIPEMPALHGGDAPSVLPGGVAAWAQHANSSAPSVQQEQLEEVPGGSFLDRFEAFNAEPPAERRGRKPRILSTLLAEAPPNIDAVSVPCPRASQVATAHPPLGPSIATSSATPKIPAVAFHKYLDRLSQKARFSGLVGTSNIADIVQEVLRQYQDSRHVDQGVLDVAAYVLDPAHFQLASGVVMQNMLDLSFGQLQSRSLRLASALWIVQEVSRHFLERQVSHQVVASGKLCYVESCSYDETPMMTAVATKTQEHQAYAHDGLDDKNDELHDVHEMMQANLLQAIPSKAKILQTKRKFGMLLHLPSGEPLILLAHSWTPLQTLQATSGEALLQALLHLCGAHHALLGLKPSTRQDVCVLIKGVET